MLLAVCYTDTADGVDLTITSTGSHPTGTPTAARFSTRPRSDPG